MKILLITIPARNESETIGGVVDSFMGEAARIGIDCCIQVVDHASTDETFAAAPAMNARVHRAPADFGLAQVFSREMELALDAGADFIIGGGFCPDLSGRILRLASRQEFLRGHSLRFIARRPDGALAG